MRRDWQKWNDEERQSLRNACADHTLTWHDIGDLIGRTGTACRMEAIKQGWVPRWKLRVVAPVNRATIADGAAINAHAAELRRRGIAQATIDMMGRK